MTGPAPAAAAEEASRFFNRELSWLEFNHRVLEEALDPSTPLLERIRFLTIVANNLDEFFMVRVGGLKTLQAQGKRPRDPSGLTPVQQLDSIGKRVRRMIDEAYKLLAETVEPALAAAGMARLAVSSLDERQEAHIRKLVDEGILPILSPLAVNDEGEPPLLVNRALYLAVRLTSGLPEARTERFAVMLLGRYPGRMLVVPGEGRHDYVLLEDAVATILARLFPGEEIAECAPFRITRNADIMVDEEFSTGYVAGMEEVIDSRKRGDVVRLEIPERVSRALVQRLQKMAVLGDDETYRIPGPIDLTDWSALVELPGRDELRYPAWMPRIPAVFAREGSVFRAIASEPQILSHPFESFEPVERFVEEAAEDPDVLAIKQILYRTSRQSPIVAALRRAAENGKYVTAIVELKARFDEERNISWARELESSGVQIIYGIRGLKTHAKACLVIRREPHGIQRYFHLGTGNYNERTAQQYTDIGLMSSDDALGADLAMFFNMITGNSQPAAFRKLAAAPLGLRARLLELIDAETERKKEGHKARIAAKVNSLSDPEIIEALYRASQAGVKVQLAVRGICCLRPGVPGLSENISVVSIVDRFLEHSRIAFFHHGGDELVFIASADWMPRNLDRRIELLVPVEHAVCKKRVANILEACLMDGVKARTLKSDGTYERAEGTGRRKDFRAQERLQSAAAAAAEAAESHAQTVFEPHRPPAA